MSTRTKLTLWVLLLIISMVGTAVLLTIFVMVPALAGKVVWYAFGASLLTGAMGGCVVTNIAYLYRE